MKQPFSSPGFLWPLLTLLCLLAILFGFKTVLKRTGWEKQQKRKIVLVTSAVIIIWIALITRLSIAGFFSDFTKLPPHLLIAILFPVPVAVMTSFSNKGS